MVQLDTVGEIIKYIEEKGWREDKSKRKNGVRTFTHPIRPGKVVINGDNEDYLPPRARDSILKQAGIK